VSTTVPGWLDAALGVEVRALTAEPLAAAGAFCTLERWTLDHDGDAPATVIAKLPREGEIRGVGQALGLYERERRFYAELAGEVPVRTARCYHPGDGDGAREPMLLEDLGAMRAGDQLHGLAVEDARALLGEAAALHARHWEGVSQDWLFALEHPVNVAVLTQVVASGLPVLRERFANRFTAAQLDTASGACERIDDVLRACGTGPMTLAHGDLRLDNLLFDGEAAIWLDWQTVARTRGTHDVAYLLSGSVDADVLSAHWRELLGSYHQALSDAGVTYAWEECLLHYRQNVLYSFVPALATLGAVAVEGERGAELADLIGARVLRHAEEIGAYATLAP
jgi:Ecdysteroid kinase-like family